MFLCDLGVMTTCSDAECLASILNTIKTRRGTAANGVIVMRKGKLRSEIMDECPDEFREELSLWIDSVEQEFKSILNHLESVKGLDDLHKIEDVRRDLDEMCDGLY